MAVIPAERRSTTALARSLTPAGAGLRGVRVLVVDDDEDGAQLAAAILSHEGASVELARSVREAFATLGRGSVDVVVSDVGMPEEDGYALVQQLRARPEHARTAAVALTAFARAEDRTKLLAAGFDGYLSKPVEAATLVAMVLALAERAQGI